MSEVQPEAPEVIPADAKDPEPVKEAPEETKNEKPSSANERAAVESQQSQERHEDVKAEKTDKLDEGQEQPKVISAAE